MDKKFIVTEVSIPGDDVILIRRAVVSGRQRVFGVSVVTKSLHKFEEDIIVYGGI